MKRLRSVGSTASTTHSKLVKHEKRELDDAAHPTQKQEKMKRKSEQSETSTCCAVNSLGWQCNSSRFCKLNNHRARRAQKQVLHQNAETQIDFYWLCVRLWKSGLASVERGSISWKSTEMERREAPTVAHFNMEPGVKLSDTDIHYIFNTLLYLKKKKSLSQHPCCSLRKTLL